MLHAIDAILHLACTLSASLATWQSPDRKFVHKHNATYLDITYATHT